MKVLSLNLILFFLPLLVLTKMDYPYNLTKLQVDTLFNNFVWSMSQNDPNMKNQQGDYQLPFGITIDTVAKIYNSFIQSLSMTSRGNPPQLQGIIFRFNEPVVNRVVNHVLLPAQNESQFPNYITNNQNTMPLSNIIQNTMPLSTILQNTTSLSNMTQYSNQFTNMLQDNNSLTLDRRGMAIYLFKQLNEFRARNGLKPLMLNEEISKRAFNHSRYMSIAGKISHDNFDMKS